MPFQGELVEGVDASRLVSDCVSKRTKSHERLSDAVVSPLVSCSEKCSSATQAECLASEGIYGSHCWRWVSVAVGKLRDTIVGVPSEQHGAYVQT